jgi:hypothetical protein
MSLDSLFKMRLGFCFTLDLIQFLSWLMIVPLAVSDCFAVRHFIPDRSFVLTVTVPPIFEGGGSPTTRNAGLSVVRA